ncbi:MAG: K(+)-transporting ATPase subunit C [Armatimonadetes bacterium]|nr:K(+)-transporting ATPase subunit C [Armatimonadota bacterium]
MKTHLLPAFRLTIVLALLTGVVYPLAITAAARLAFPYSANGSLLRDARGRVVGSALLGQRFGSPRYFQPRPSAAGDGYDAAASAGSNLGPTSRKLADAMAERVAAYRQLNGLAATQPVPADAVTASASGLDPHISPANAYLQVARVARERGLSVEQVGRLVARHTQPRQLGFLGEPRVNVLRLNLDLDAPAVR